jgi:hypothetical protein
VEHDEECTPFRIRRAAQRIALGHPNVAPPAEVVAVILAEKWGVPPSTILEMDFGEILRWWQIVNDLNTTKGGQRGV